METHSGSNAELKEFFTNHLKTLYWAEKKLLDTLADMEDAAKTGELKSALRDHLVETQQHVIRLQRVFNIIGEEAQSEKCKIMESITHVASKMINNTHDGSYLRDVSLIFSGQLAEHYEIASYGTLIQLAKTLGYNDVANIFYQTLEEEKRADKLLTEIAEENVNRKAAGFNSFANAGI